MSKRIEIIEKALVVTDTVTSEVELDVPKGSYYYNPKRLADNGHIVFFNLDIDDNWASNPEVIQLSEAVDSTDTPFTEETFTTFCRENLI